jgi:ParB family chromosome partitioning protein
MPAELDLSIDLDALGAPDSSGAPLLLDPQTIQPSRWANRHASTFVAKDFEELKADIKSAGGNVQPIKVRPLREPNDDAKYEVVFGHRRHRACLELGLQVSAWVVDLDERALWREMELENRGRKDLSAWEQGAMYARAIDEGLFPSLRSLAQTIGRDAGDVSKALRIARLPPEVVAAFQSPNEIQFRYAKELDDAVQANHDEVMRVARSLAGTQRPANDVFLALTQVPHAIQARTANHSTADASHPVGSGVGPSNTARRSNSSGQAGQRVGPSNGSPTGSDGISNRAVAHAPAQPLRVVVTYLGAEMEVATDAKPRKGSVPVRSLGNDEVVQYVAAAELKLIRTESR